ncbi:PTS sugar transporter subunit IIA [Nocardiopsis sp. HNM0947]|uniref:Ascorbate-specific PTS system EIIA component n=1 Tax=Nocardiopsis coralli TaxID=2772213 RepID=A0ABR9PDN6_9ACTN|nr:PTS sugar transporter subunit IIA [Nocardiopsis coralli]MBE3001929.1 PTS sugar transporter subunit IIA [Nocardiopsis coralli]
MASLDELISDESIVLDVQAADWQDAIRSAGALLESAGVSTEAYTQAMVDNVTENGPYIVVAPGFAFAHARPSGAVLRTGMSWVRLAEPVAFGHESHDPVDLVVALAAEDSSAHTRAMADLAKILGKPDKRAALDAARSPAEVRAILTGQEPAPAPATGTAGSTGTTGTAGTAGTTGTAGTAGTTATANTPGTTAAPEEAHAGGASAAAPSGSAGEDWHLVLTVCGNGLGTSLFLKNTLEQVLDTWGWSRFLTVEATDTISARGRAGEAKAILTSEEIARTLGDVGVPVRVIENFTSTDELDAALRDLYDV